MFHGVDLLANCCAYIPWCAEAHHSLVHLVIDLVNADTISLSGIPVNTNMQSLAERDRKIKHAFYLPRSGSEAIVAPAAPVPLG